MKWQPIETAPRDGTHVLLLIGEVAIGGCWVLHSEGWESGIPDWYGWDTDNDLILIEVPDDEPTHWMPIPPPPQTDTAAPCLGSPAPCRMAEDGATRKDAQGSAVSPESREYEEVYKEWIKSLPIKIRIAVTTGKESK